jgi:hypothetical protein
VWLTTLLLFIAVPASFNIEKAQKSYYALLLLLEVGITGVFVSLDYFLFYVFWEVMLLPMYFLIGIWGGPRREYAAIKFFLYTLAGSVLMLVAVVALRIESGTFSIPDLVAMAHAGRTHRLEPAVRRRARRDEVHDLGVLVPVRRLRDQGAGLPVPHLAARRARAGADADLGDPGGHPAEARRLRDAARVLPDRARRLPRVRVRARRARRHQHRVRVATSRSARRTSSG